MDNLKMHSLDGVQRNIELIGKLFPNAITEVKRNGKVEHAIDFDVLRQELSDSIVEGREERYQFTWPDKKKAMLAANAPITATLRPVVADSVDKDGTPGGFDSENLYIEGDNLEVLKLLQETYLGKVKMIYIDPPYNTGSDAFVYDDNRFMNLDDFEDISGLFDENGNLMFDIQTNNEASGKFHTNWLNMIYPRLKIARDLLSEDGLIFVSIDDNEIENMTKICNEIFGTDNHVETVIWKNKYGAGAKTVGFISAHEYILIYSKNPISNLTCEFEGAEREKYNKRDGKFAIRGPYRTQPLMTNSLGDRPNLMYSIFHNGVEIVPRKQWVWSKERMEAAIANDDVEFSLQKDGSYTVRSKSYLYGEDGSTRRGKPVSVLNGPFTQDGTKEMRELFDDIAVFDFTKPSKLIEYLLNLEINDINDKNFIVMDFFSGSATTAHAVMKLNAEDGGHRKFIMVQLPEKTDEKSEAYKAGYKNICEIGKERIRRAGEKIKSESPMTTQDLDVGFRVLRLDDTNMKDVYYAPDDYDQGMLAGLESNIKDDRTDLDLLFGCLIDWGLPLSLPYSSEQIDGCTVHTYNDGDLIACFDANIPESVVKEIAKRRPLRAVFRDSGFSSSPEKINVFEIFKLYMPEDANDITKRVRVI